MAKYQPKVELMPLDQIKPYDRNAKIHTEAQVRSLVEVIKSQGWDVPIVVDRNGVVIKGHGRRLAALSMGLTEVPVIVRRDLTDAQVKAARLSDNRVAMGDFDVDLIRDELSELKTDGYDLDTTGFGEKELQIMLGDLDAIDMTVFDTPTETTPTAALSDSGAVADADATPAAPAEKALLLSDLLGFKHVPAKYKDVIIELMSRAEMASDAKGAEAFGELVTNLVKGE